MKKRRDINFEKANQLMKKSKNHSNKEAAKSADADKEVQLMKKSKNHSNKEAAESADKVVVVVNEKRSNDDDDDDDVGKTEDHKKPEVFQSKSNLEIVAWLIN